MSTSTKLIEFFARVPQCKADGTNWTFYRDRFMFAAEAAQLDDYLVETAAPPSVPVPANPTNPTNSKSLNHPGSSAFYISETAPRREDIQKQCS